MSIEELVPTNITAIVIAKPSVFRESLQILLTSISLISEVLPSENLVEAVNLAGGLTPSIVVLDTQSIDRKLLCELEQISGTWKEAKLIVLAEDKDEVTQASTHGADLILMKGFNASQFINGIEALLNKH